MKELSLYIHIPFCIQKCHYCDFLSFPSNEEEVRAYFDALYKEISVSAPTYAQDCIKTVFIGGGTPTAVPSAYICKTLDLIKQHYSVHPQCEVSIESNPATFDQDKLMDYRKAGINRLSIGLQCWQDRLLKSIGRIHTQADFIQGYTEAREAGFDNINVDLMFSLPHQTLEDWKETLEEVCHLAPTHLSCYSLNLEEGTVLFEEASKNNWTLDEALDRKMYHYAIEYLEKRGYDHYEISNFSKPGYSCKHNLVYWDVKPYIGFGLGAHSCYGDLRFYNEENLCTYIERINHHQSVQSLEERLTETHKKEEFVFLGLRKIEGIDDKNYQGQFKDSIFVDYKEEIEKLSGDGLIDVNEGKIKLSKLGLDFANQVFMCFIRD